MKKIALFVALVVIFGGIYSYVYLSNSRNINANIGGSSISKICDCVDPAKCKAEGICDGECEDKGKEKDGNCKVESCQQAPTKAVTPAPYVPPCCRVKENK